MTTQVNPTLENVESIFKGLAWDNLVSGVLLYFKIDVWPLNSFIRLITDKLFDLFKTSFDLQAIVFINDQHKDAFTKAMVTLKIIAHDKGIDSQEFRKAKENAKEYLAQFVHFNG